MSTAAAYQKKPRLQAVVAVYLIIECRDRVLWMIREGTGYQDGMYGLPAGHLEGAEVPKRGLRREVEEELGKRIANAIVWEDVELVHTSYRPQHDLTGNRIDLYFWTQCDNADELVENAEPHKCARLEWVQKEGVCEMNGVSPHQFVAVLGWIAGQIFTEMDEEWLRANGEWNL